MDRNTELELNQLLIKLQTQLPSNNAGIEAGEMIVNAVANQTNEHFKRRTIDYVRKNFSEYIKDQKGNAGLQLLFAVAFVSMLMVGFATLSVNPARVAYALNTVVR